MSILPLCGRFSVSGAKRSTFMCANIGSNFARTHRTRILIRSATVIGIASSLIWRDAAIAGEEEQWIEKQLPDSTDAQSSVARVRALAVALQRRAILKWLRAQKISAIGFDVMESVRSLADHDAATAKVNLPRDRHVRRRAGKIFIE